MAWIGHDSPTVGDIVMIELRLPVRLQYSIAIISILTFSTLYYLLSSPVGKLSVIVVVPLQRRSTWCFIPSYTRACSHSIIPGP